MPDCKPQIFDFWCRSIRGSLELVDYYTVVVLPPALSVVGCDFLWLALADDEEIQTPNSCSKPDDNDLRFCRSLLALKSNTMHDASLSNWNLLVVLHCMLIALNSEIVTAYSASLIQLSEELGCSPTLAQVFGKETVYFDPLGIATDTYFARFRETELKHGQIAMVAIMGLYAAKIPVQDMLEACKSTRLLSIRRIPRRTRKRRLR
jgi:hypothetical protein